MIVPPLEYARGKLAMLRRRWQGPEGDAVRAFGPLVWPGTPPTALLGLTASSVGPREVVGDARAEASAVGLFGVERPQVARYAAGPDASEVEALLGRPSRPEPAYLDDLNAQVVTGLLNYRRHLGALLDVRAVGLELVEGSPPGSSLRVRLAAAAYSSGEAVPAAGLGAFRAELVATQPAERWQRYAELVATTEREQLGGVAINGPWRIAFNILRAEQRLECGRALDAAELGGANAAWFDAWAETKPGTIARLVERANAGAVVTGGDAATSSAPLALLAAAAAWYLWR